MISSFASRNTALAGQTIRIGSCLELNGCHKRMSFRVSAGRVAPRSAGACSPLYGDTGLRRNLSDCCSRQRVPVKTIYLRLDGRQITAAVAGRIFFSFSRKHHALSDKQRSSIAANGRSSRQWCDRFHNNTARINKPYKCVKRKPVVQRVERLKQTRIVGIGV